VKRRQEGSDLKPLRAALATVIDELSADGWLERPNKQFDGSTPLQLIERGETDRIWRMISQLRDGNSG